MCGIAGILTLDGGSTRRGEVSAMTRSLAHRGPDGEGVHVSGPIGLGNRRLAVLDLGETGRQPMSFAGGRYWITYNGEIYNFLELKTSLEEHGHQFHSESDTEVILAAYVQWGEACQLRFNGMWAFAIWDDEERRLFLSRDRFGVKPLFYYFDGHRLAFASEMKAFLPLPWFPASFDLPAVACSLENPYALEPTDFCLLEGVRRLKAAHSLTIEQGGEPRVRCWWRTLDHLEEPSGDFSRQTERFREILLDAVRIRMRSDIPLACSLSGGVDSSSIVGAMTCVRLQSGSADRLAAQPPTAFVASFPETSHDEVSCAQEVAGHAGIPARVLEVVPSLMPGLLDEFVFQCEEVQSPNLGPWLVYREMSRAGIRVTLDGHGGDELLAGYVDQVRFARDNALFPVPRILRATELTSVLRRMQGVGEDRTSLRDWGVAGGRYLELVKARLAARCGWSDHRGPAGASRWLRVPPLRDQSRHALEGKPKLSPLTTYLYIDFHERSIPTILRDFDRFSMAHGVEVRSPFMDWRLACYCFSLPCESVLGEGFTKRILREAMRGLLPEGILRRSRKIPFKSPMSEWWRGPLLELVRDTVGSDSFLSSEIWNGPGIRDLVENTSSSDRFEGALMIFRFIAAHRLMQLFRSARATRLAAVST